MGGRVKGKAGIDFLSSKLPLPMSQIVLPEDLGRVHTEMALNIRLASPYVFGTSANVQCGPSEIRLESRGNVLSRWIHWYTDWEPTMFPELESAVGSMTTVLKSRLDQLRACHGVEIARLVRVRRGTKEEIYEEHKVETESYWA